MAVTRPQDSTFLATAVETGRRREVQKECKESLWESDTTHDAHKAEELRNSKTKDLAE